MWADGAYRSAYFAAKLSTKGLFSKIHSKGRCNKSLSEREQRGFKTRFSGRARVGQVFGSQANDMGGTLVLSIGIVRARARIAPKRSRQRSKHEPVGVDLAVIAQFRNQAGICGGAHKHLDGLDLV